MDAEISTILLYLAVFLAAAKVGGVLAARFGIPGILGELLAGIVVGPFVAGWLSQLLFGVPLFIDMGAPAGEFVGVLGNLGIVILLFLAGLSIELEEFKKAEKPAVLTAFSGVLVAFVLGFGLGLFAGWTALQAAFVGAVLAATSVGITVRTLVDLHVLHTPVGITILGAAVIDDVVAIIILGVLSGLAMGAFTLVGLAQNLMLMAGFFLVLIVGGLKALPRVFTFVDRLHVEEITLSIALAFVFFIGAIAEVIGIAALTGAFLVGLVLSRAPIAVALRNKVTTVGYGFLIPLFFVEMGARMDLGTLAGVGPLSLALVGVAVFDKVIGCGAGAFLGGFRRRDALRVGVGMMPRAEIALVIAAIGTKAGIVSPVLLSMTIMVVLITTLITPMCVKLAFREMERKGEK